MNPTRQELFERWPRILGLWAVPVSIAAAEILLSLAALAEIRNLLTGRRRVRWPASVWLWLVWAVLEALVWANSPNRAEGWGEIRHLLLLAVLFVALSGFERKHDTMVAWTGVFVTATLSSLVLIGQFLFKLRLYGAEIAGGGDAAYYLRSGGLAGHWMVYATVEIVVVAGLIAALPLQGPASRWVRAMMPAHAVAVVFSLTRMAWLTCLVLLVIWLAWSRSRWLWTVPLGLLVVYGLSPEPIRSRAANLSNLTYYSNQERIQMMAVGGRMIGEHPWTGVGAGRVEDLYTSYLRPGEPVPAYHGHLHNNVAQLAAQFGLPVTAAALLFVVAAFRDLVRARRTATDPESLFLANTAVLALTAFLLGGLFEYTYGHALGLIMVGFAVIPALPTPDPAPSSDNADKFIARAGLDGDTAPSHR